jgi:fumarate reductase (CoM/CoB) subunit A
MAENFRRIDCDVLVIGSGAAGCAAAISAAGKTARVVMVNKGVFGRSGTTCLGGAMYAAALGQLDEGDSAEYHFLDTLTEGRYLGNQELIKVLVEEAPRTVYDLERYGVQWYKRGDRQKDRGEYRYEQLPGPGHRFRRGLTHNETTGRAIQTALCREVMRHAGNIRVVDDIYIWTLVVADRRVRGAVGLDLRTGEAVVLSSKAVVMSTGGAGSSYKITDMDTGATGDGYAMALRAGAELVDMEFTQFFPTAFAFPESIRGILVPTSPLWTKGLKLYNSEDERFLAKQYPDRAENIPRDLLSGAVFEEIARGKGTAHGGVWLDATDIEDWEETAREHPRSFSWPKHFGITGRRFEVAPTYHFTMGGVRIDKECRTSVAGLFAAGEAAGGLHGANRLAGNALAECVVFGQIAGGHAADLRKESLGPIEGAAVEEQMEERFSAMGPARETGGSKPSSLVAALREIMYRGVGVKRMAKGLEEARQEVARIREEAGAGLRVARGRVFNYSLVQGMELLNMLDLCEAVIEAALAREESRGSHLRSDYPGQDNENWLKNIICVRRDGKLELRTRPVALTYTDPSGLS